jgi:hypothetical protein
MAAVLSAMFEERHEFFSWALHEVASLSPGWRRDDRLEELARALGGHLRSVEHGTNAALRRVAPQFQVVEVMHRYTAVSASLARLLANTAGAPPFANRLSELRAAIDQMKVQEAFVVRQLSRRLGETALLMVELEMEERFDEYVGVVGIHGVMSGAVLLAAPRRFPG